MPGTFQLWNGKFLLGQNGKMAVHPACCCGDEPYTGPCPEVCGCCEEYEGPTPASLGIYNDTLSCLWVNFPTRLTKYTPISTCYWLSHLSADLVAGTWQSLSAGTSGAIPQSCLDDIQDFRDMYGMEDMFYNDIYAGSSISCTNLHGPARWLYGMSMLWGYIELQWCADLGVAACPPEGDFTLTSVILGTNCEDLPHVSEGYDYNGTLTGFDCDNPLP